jgi:hypothetical protein
MRENTIVYFGVIILKGLGITKYDTVLRFMLLHVIRRLLQQTKSKTISGTWATV